MSSHFLVHFAKEKGVDLFFIRPVFRLRKRGHRKRGQIYF